MIARTGTFFDQEAVDEYADKAGGPGQFQTFMQTDGTIEDSQLMSFLNDGTSPFSPRAGEWDTAVRLQELEDDGTAGEVIFPQMAPFGAGLLQYRHDVAPDQKGALQPDQ